MASPSISVLMPNYNHARFLPEALKSVLEQSYRPTEVIVIDDASTDDSIAVLEEFARREPAIRLIRNETNRGVIANLNRLIGEAAGDYLQFVAADDIILPGIYEKSIRLLERHPEAGLCSGLSTIIDAEGRDQGVLTSSMVANEATYLSPEQVRSALLSLNYHIPAGTVVYRRQAVLDAKGFVPDFQLADYFLILVVSLKHGACFIPEMMAAWRRIETGFGMTYSSDLEVMSRVIRRGAELMRSDYAHLFPPKYVTRWERSRYYELRKLALQKLRAHQETFLAEMSRTEPQPSWYNRSLLRMLRLAASAETSFTRGILLAAMGYVPMREIRRKLTNR